MYMYKNKQDWPNKFDINKLVSRPKDIEKIVSGEKTSVRRNDRYADNGDEVLLNGHLFVVENIYPQKLKDVTEQEAKQEGYESLDSYKKALTSIHDGAVWDPEAVVWVHELREK